MKKVLVVLFLVALAIGSIYACGGGGGSSSGGGGGGGGATVKLSSSASVGP